MKKLAINGGKKIRTKLFPFCTTIDGKEIQAVIRVLKTGILSKYLGQWHEDFYGGPQVRALEKEWAKYFHVKHAISVNSATSGLICAVGASGVGPGDEVIVTPYSMCISATVPLFYDAVPQFADIEEDYFCLDPKSVEERITKYTKAIIVVDLFGQSYDADRINKIARKHKITVIEDCAQAPLALYRGKFAGTLGDIGIYSLNYHKQIQSGEGGMVVTDNDKLADKVRLIRNHAEAVVEGMGVADLVNMVGFNFRMTEIEATITREQLKKLRGLILQRRENVNYINKKLEKIPFIEPAKTRPGSTHVYYFHPFKFNEKKAGISRNTFLNAVKAELMPGKNREKEPVQISSGYVKPLYLMPIFQKKIFRNESGFPFKSPLYYGKANYKKGMCPVVERMHEKEFFAHDLMRPGMAKTDLDDLIGAFHKVADNIGELK